MDVIRNRETGEETAPTRLAAGMVEDAVVAEVRRILQTPEIVSHVAAALKEDRGQASEADADRGPPGFPRALGAAVPR